MSALGSTGMRSAVRRCSGDFDRVAPCSAASGVHPHRLPNVAVGILEAAAVHHSAHLLLRAGVGLSASGAAASTIGRPRRGLSADMASNTWLLGCASAIGLPVNVL